MLSAPIILLLIVLIIYMVVMWLAIAFWVVRDARRRSESPLFILVATLLGFAPPFFGALIYIVLAPPRTLEEERTLALEERALLDMPEATEVAPTRPCPNCGRDIERDFVMCPYCRTQFARRCAGCHRTLRLGWPVCPYCAEEVGVHDLGRTGHAFGS